MNENARVKIYRFDPSVDKEARYEQYEVPPEGWRDLMVIDTLKYIYENLDSDLAFRGPCHIQVCGACTVMVNNKLCLACETPSKEEMLIEPVSKSRVLKDLIVDSGK